jgi:hypothetical protein
VSSRQSTARFFGVQRQQLLSESKVFQNEILTGTKSTENPTEKVPESQDHGRKFIGIRGTKPLSKWLIPRVCEVLTRHNHIQLLEITGHFPISCRDQAFSQACAFVSPFWLLMSAIEMLQQLTCQVC